MRRGKGTEFCLSVVRMEQLFPSSLWLPAGRVMLSLPVSLLSPPPLPVQRISSPPSPDKEGPPAFDSPKISMTCFFLRVHLTDVTVPSVWRGFSKWIFCRLIFGSPSRKPWEKNMDASYLFGWQLQEGPVGDWESDRGKGTKSIKCGVMSKSLLWNLGFCSQTLREPVRNLPQNCPERVKKSAYLSSFP